MSELFQFGHHFLAITQKIGRTCGISAGISRLKNSATLCYLT